MKKLQIIIALLATLFSFLAASAQGEWKWANYWSGNGGTANEYYNQIVKTALDEAGNIYVFGTWTWWSFSTPAVPPRASK